MRPTPSRLVASAAAVLMTAVALTGCSAGSDDGCRPLAASGPASDSVTVQGAFGAKPTVSFPSPMHVDRTQVTTNIAGRGEPIDPQQQVVADVTFLDGTTGQAVTATEYTGDAAAARFVVGSVGVPGLRKALVCAREGERLTAVMPPGQGIPAASRPEGLTASDSLVAVVDVRRAYLARADGTPQVMAGGLPAVVLAADGRPGVTLPQGAPPKSLQVALLRAGDGPVVRRGEDAVVQYTGVVWKPGDPADGEVFDSSWANGAPVTLPVSDGQIIPGLAKALAGQRVGSQVLAVIPPAQGYGDQATGKIPAGATLVFVVDLLGKA
ncbi:FKBP-type peptidyl-prolyl cis-trans isomerase [Amnibacterium endophyticum]|uniref:peptidylprolyl isomerase n=1 Tax=Amnibacterium endophyticum TaxID=2109337 RepID=A0ABW4LGW3_9MICO